MLQTRLQLTPLGARIALAHAGYEAGEDGLWRLSDSTEAQLLQAALERVEIGASQDVEGGWEDTFPLDDGDED